MIAKAESHRGRHRLWAILGRTPKCLYRWSPYVSDCYEVTDEEAARLKAAKANKASIGKGWRLTRITRDELSECWSTGA